VSPLSDGHHFQCSLFHLGFGLLHHGQLYFFSEAGKNSITLPGVGKRNLSAPLDMDAFLAADRMLQHRRIRRDQVSLLEAGIRDTMIEEGSPSDYSVGNVIAVLYDEFFPALTGLETSRVLEGAATFAQVSDERKERFSLALGKLGEEIRQRPSYEQFAQTVGENLSQMTSQRHPPDPDFMHIIQGLRDGTYLMWDSEYYAEGHGRSVELTINGTEERVSLDLSDTMTEVLADGVSDRYSAYLASTITEDRLRETYSKAKYANLIAQGGMNHEGFGFEILRSEKPGIFLYADIPAFFMKDPRPQSTWYYPFKQERVGLSIAFAEGEVRILGNIVRGPTKHIGIQAPDHQYTSMCGFAQRPRDAFSSTGAWLCSNLSHVIEMFTNGFSPDYIQRHRLSSDPSVRVANLPEPVSLSGEELEGKLITNLHEWPT
jgi:hypothetical protein